MAYNHEKKLSDSLKKIEKVFQGAKQKGLTFGGDEDKSRNGDSTYQDYAKKMKTVMREVYQKYNIADITKVQHEHIEGILEDRIVAGQSPYTIYKIPFIVDAFKQASGAVQGVFKREVNLIDKEQIINGLFVREDIVRRPEDSKTMQATSEDNEKVRVEILKSNSPNKDVASAINKFQEDTGSRIQAALHLQVKDINFKENTITFIKDKGGLTHETVDIDSKTIEWSKSYCDGKKPGAPVFQVKHHHGELSGKDMKVKKAIDAIDRIYKAAAKKAGIERDGKKYSSHSPRKTFGQNRMNHYSKQTRDQLEKEKNNRINRDNQNEKAGRGSADLGNKYQADLRNYNKKRKNKQTNMSHKELCKWLTSVDLGHGRGNAVAYYASYPGDNSDALSDESSSYGFNAADFDVLED